MFTKLYRKIRTIILSRFNNNKEEEWVKKRRVTCLECDYNSLNNSDRTLWLHILAALSYFYSLITGNSKEDGSFGYCNVCGCDCFYKTSEEDGYCQHPKGNKWEKLEDGSVKLDIFKQRKDANK